jgi:hypothetical protein
MQMGCIFCAPDKLRRAGSKLTSYWQSGNNSTKLSWAREEKQQTCRREYLQSKQLFQSEEKSPLSVCCMHADAGNSQIELTFWKMENILLPDRCTSVEGELAALYILPTSGNFFFRIEPARIKLVLLAVKEKLLYGRRR